MQYYDTIGSDLVERPFTRTVTQMPDLGTTPPLSCVSTAFTAKTLPLPCVSTAFLATTPPLLCVPTAFLAKTRPCVPAAILAKTSPLPCVLRLPARLRDPAFPCGPQASCRSNREARPAS